MNIVWWWCLSSAVPASSSGSRVMSLCCDDMVQEAWLSLLLLPVQCSIASIYSYTKDPDMLQWHKLDQSQHCGILYFTEVPSQLVQQGGAEAAEDVRSRGGQGAEGSSIEACSGNQSAQSAEKNFSPSFFNYQDGLSWHLRALYWCTRNNAVK